jgi:hypothetical protein
VEAPFRGQRVEQPAQIARWVVHVRLLDLHVVQAHDGVQLDGPRIGLFAHDLPMHLAARGNVDHDIREHPRRA